MYTYTVYVHICTVICLSTTHPSTMAYQKTSSEARIKRAPLSVSRRGSSSRLPGPGSRRKSLAMAPGAAGGPRVRWCPS